MPVQFDEAFTFAQIEKKPLLVYLGNEAGAPESEAEWVCTAGATCMDAKSELLEVPIEIYVHNPNSSLAADAR